MNVENVNFSLNGLCPYLKDRYWSLLRLEVDSISKAEYENLLNIGFRKNGNVFYLPKCRICEECRSLRVEVNNFKPSKQNRKILKKNFDLKLLIKKPTFSKEKFEMYKNYISIIHKDDLNYDVEHNYKFSFLKSTNFTEEMNYYLGNKLVAVGIIEVLNTCISSVYFYYDIKYSNRSLGLFSIMKEIEYTLMLKKKYLHLGYYVHNCSSMSYKARFMPNEILFGNLFWIDGEEFIKKYYNKNPDKDTNEGKNFI